MSLIIKNVLLNDTTTDIQIIDHLIARIAPDIEAGEDEREINGRGKAAFPAFINGHTHAAMTLLRGYADDMFLMDWLRNKIWPLEAEMTDEDQYWAVKFAALEMIQNGVTFFSDMYWDWEVTAQAVTEMGLRAAIAGVTIDNGEAFKRKSDQERIEKMYRLSSSYAPNIIYSLGPHAIYTVSEEQLRWISEFSRQNNLLIHLHLSETEHEVKDCLKATGLRPVEYLDSIGFLSSKVIAVHAIWMNDREMDILQEKGVSVISVPVSNMKLAVGKAFPWSAIRQRNIPIGFGTDGVASNNNLDMLETAKAAALYTKVSENNPTALNAREAFDALTLSAAGIFGLNSGIIAPGRDADIILVDLNHTAMIPRHHLISNLIYSANGSVVDTTICQGKILMENRIIPNEEEIKIRFRHAAEDLVSRH